jgi:hypothetical protein
MAVSELIGGGPIAPGALELLVQVQVTYMLE